MLPVLMPTVIVGTVVGTYGDGVFFLHTILGPVLGIALMVPILFFKFAPDRWIQHTYGNRRLSVFMSSYIPVMGVPLLVLFLILVS